MEQKKKGFLVFAAAALLLGLLFMLPDAMAADGDLNAENGVLLKDTNSNGKIDEVQVTVDYAVGTANAISHAVDAATTISKFTVTNAVTGNPVSISSIGFVSGNGSMAVFKLVLDENDADLAVDTSAAALDVVYDATGANLKITDGTSPVAVASISSNAIEKDGAQPIIVKAEDQNGTSLDGGINIPTNANIVITFSEPMDTTTLDSNNEWSISPDPGNWLTPVWNVSNKFVTLGKTGNFASGYVETVTLSAPMAAGGFTSGYKALQNNPDAGAVSNPFSFTIGSGTATGGCDDDEDEDDEDDEDDDDDDDDECDDDDDDDDITPPEGADVGNPTTPNYHSGVILYRVPGDHRVYVIKNKKKHWIKTPKEFEDGGYKWEEIKEISAKLLEKYPDAETLVNELLRAVGDFRVYVIKDGKKHWVKTSEEFEQSGYDWKKIKEVAPEVLATYQNDILSNLLRAVGDYKVYVVENGKKRWIKTAAEFISEGHKWEDIQEVENTALEGYPELSTISGIIKIINASSLRVRSENSTAGDILGSVKNAETYKIIEKKGGWYKIKTKSGKTGWVSGLYTQEQ